MLIFCVHTPYKFIRVEVKNEDEAQAWLNSSKLIIWRAELFNIVERDRQGNALIGELIRRFK